jgi:hypothetical protein
VGPRSRRLRRSRRRGSRPSATWESPVG